MIEKLISYSYLMDYDATTYVHDTGIEDHRHITEHHTNAEMYALGEKYDFPELKVLAGRKFDQGLKEGPTAPTFLHLWSLIHIIYTSTPGTDHGMRERILRFASKLPKFLTTLPEFGEMVTQNIDFVHDMFSRKTPQKIILPYNGECTRCKSKDKWKADHVTCSCGWGQRC